MFFFNTENLWWKLNVGRALPHPTVSANILVRFNAKQVRFKEKNIICNITVLPSSGLRGGIFCKLFFKVEKIIKK